MLQRDPHVDDSTISHTDSLRTRSLRTLEQCATSRYFRIEYVVVLRTLLCALSMSHVILFGVSREYAYPTLQALNSTLICFVALLLLFASLLFYTVSTPTRRSLSPFTLIIAPLLQSCITLAVFNTIVVLGLKPPRKWRYSTVAALFLDPFIAITHALSSQLIDFRVAHSALPIAILLAVHSSAAANLKPAMNIVKQYVNYQRFTKRLPVANAVIVVAALCSAVFAFSLGHFSKFIAWTSSFVVGCKRMSDVRENDTVVSERSADPDDENCDHTPNDIDSADGDANNTMMTCSNLPWFSRSTISFDEPDDWKQVESEYGSRALGSARA